MAAKGGSKFERWLRTKYPKDYEKLWMLYEADTQSDKKIPFADFWSTYDKKVGTKDARAKWERLSAVEQAKAMAVIEDYKRAQPERKYRLNPTTYLNGEHYNDEQFIEARQATNSAESRAARNIEAWNTILG
jgi:hypothetical protein